MCATDKDSLGSTHCATAVGKYSDVDKGGNIGTLFFRGCIDCANKKEACFALGGWLKEDQHKTLLECEIECCTSDNCNNQTTPTLTKDAITVFTPNVSGPAQCNECFGSNATSCNKNQKNETCATDRDSLGTTHCGSAKGTSRENDGNVTSDFFIRGCINCADKKAACAAIGGLLVNDERIRVLECEIECCTDSNCNIHDQSLEPIGGPTTKPTVSAGREVHYVLFSGVLASVLAFGNILYHL
ncbi:hypothetical protein OS493_032299 [Desmophyllum pertusum]|uniref:Uncharacterized protein n=1 Tax=Desmophyllum pertusum TaxID=174260 RepID=A0A9X0CR45_9CNID|nr:hypothetical protein OS493_032299 [Desmophyllum pertusum]